MAAASINVLTLTESNDREPLRFGRAKAIREAAAEKNWLFVGIQEARRPTASTVAGQHYNTFCSIAADIQVVSKDSAAVLVTEPTMLCVAIKEPCVELFEDTREKI